MGQGTTNYGLSRPTVGSDNNTWGTQINTALETVDSQLYNKTDRRDSKGVAITLNFSGNTITDASTSSEFKNYAVGDRLYITNASNNNANRGEFYVNGVTSDNVLVMKKSDTSTDANFVTENNVSSVVSLVVREPFTRHVFSHLTGEIRLFASTTLATIQGLGSISDGGATRYAWLACNGQAVSKTVYKDLYEVLKNGTSAGIFGEAGGNFNLPDLRGRVPVGDISMGISSATGRMPTSGDHIGESGGSHDLTLSVSQIPAHTHHNSHSHTLTGTQTLSHSSHKHNFPGDDNLSLITDSNWSETSPVSQPGGYDAQSYTSGSGKIWRTSGSNSDDHTVTFSDATVESYTGDTGQVVETHASSNVSTLQPYQVIGSYIIAT